MSNTLFAYKIIAVILLVISGLSSTAQVKSIYIPTYDQGDTTPWYKWQHEKYGRAGLPDLMLSTDLIHVRYATEIQAIDIWSEDGINFSGSITCFTHDRKAEESEEQFFFDRNRIELDTALMIYQMILGARILVLPPQDSITGWEHGEDGWTLFIEYSTPTEYFFHDYWTPSHYIGRISEARRLYEFSSDIAQLMDMKARFRQFINTLPSGTYSAGSNMLITTPAKRKRNRNQ